MDKNVKKWLLSGIVFLLAGIVMIGITLALSFMDSILYKYIIFPLMCILAGLITMNILNKIDSITTPTLTSTHTWIFAIYSTIITGIIIIMTQIMVRLNEAMLQLSQAMAPPDALGINLGTLFGSVHPIYAGAVAFIGLNLAYVYYYYKHPEKNWKDFIPHLCCILILVAVYMIDIYGVLTKLSII